MHQHVNRPRHVDAAFTCKIQPPGRYAVTPHPDFRYVAGFLSQLSGL